MNKLLFCIYLILITPRFANSNASTNLLSDTPSQSVIVSKSSSDTTRNANKEARPLSEVKSTDTKIGWKDYSLLLGLIGSALAWLYNERQKRIGKLIEDKEARYKELVTLIRTFGSGSENVEKANQFIAELQLCWMYCPDSIIKKGNEFLLSMKETDISKEERQSKIDIAKGELILEIRRDLKLTGKFALMRYIYSIWPLTKLTAADFKDVYYQSQALTKDSSSPADR